MHKKDPRGLQELNLGVDSVVYCFAGRAPAGRSIWINSTLKNKALYTIYVKILIYSWL